MNMLQTAKTCHNWVLCTLGPINKCLLHPKALQKFHLSADLTKHTMCTYRLCPDKGYDRQKLTHSLNTSRHGNIRNTELSGKEANIFEVTMKVNLAAVPAQVQILRDCQEISGHICHNGDGSHQSQCVRRAA